MLLALASYASAARADESVRETVCRLVDGAAAASAVPAEFLTRLIWQESSFRADVVSRAGARGIAQFMPGTARERGLADPFDPEQAIPAAARFVAELRGRFGNLGLAAAAYNGGPTRVASWLAGRGELADETLTYVVRITGRGAGEWAEEARKGSAATPPAPAERGCLVVSAELRQASPGLSILATGATAPWGVQLAGNFSKALALAAFERSRSRSASVLGDVTPMVIGGRLRFRGSRTFYRVRVPAQSRGEATALCSRLRAVGGACVVLRS